MDRLSTSSILPETFQGTRDDMTEQIALFWQLIRSPIVAPLLNMAVYICLVMSVMLFIERVYMAVVIVLVKVFGKKPEKRYKWEPIKDDVEIGNTVYPMVLVQVPMYNEREVYQLSIGAACGLSWPSDRIIVQVLDDSTDPIIKDLVEMECQKWASKGINIKYEIRDNRNGYKAGALKEGMKRGYARECDYVVIFDADFEPEPDFLWRTVPFLMHNPELGLVQARWKFVTAGDRHYRRGFFSERIDECRSALAPRVSWRNLGHMEGPFSPCTVHVLLQCPIQGLFCFLTARSYGRRKTEVEFTCGHQFSLRAQSYGRAKRAIQLLSCRMNADECLMTRMQEMSLDYHFNVEQEVGSSTHAFFGFNGTAGVWRINALNEAGGWKDRTTVEDMDLAVRASLKGWKFVFLGNLGVKNELPSTFKAYRYQQHRWSCGPANLFRKMIMEIITNKKVSAWKKFHVIYGFFFVRKIVAHIVTFVFYCVIIPATVLVPEVQLPKWGAVYIPSTITILNALSTPRSLHLLVFWILFENVMSLHRTKATMIGLLEAGRVNEWVVTEKLGDALKHKTVKQMKKPRSRIGERIHVLELLTGVYLFFCASYDLAFGKNHFFIYLYLQAGAFFIMGFGYIGTFVPTS
eukprot:Gb_27616 [translate_table: standard]